MLENKRVATAVQQELSDPRRNVRIAAAWALRATLDTNSRAGQDLLRMLAVNADQPAGQLQWGNYFFARGDVATACRHLQTAVAWDGFSTPLRLELAIVLSALNRTPEAVAQLRTACRNSPRDPQVHFNLGLALNEQGQPAQARKELETAVDIEPQFARAWYNLALLQNAGDEAQTAIRSLQRAETADPADARIPYARATILARLGKTDEARSAARRALEIEPDFAAALTLLQQLGAR